MSKGTKITIGVVLAIILVVGVVVTFLFSVKFQSEKYENQIEASYKNNQNVYSSVDKILESSGITTKHYSKTVINAIKENAKKFENNQNLMMQWVQENPLQIDSTVWQNFQKEITTQYTKFEMEQKLKISMSQAYKDYLESTFRGQVAQIVWSFPRKETVDMMNQVVQTENTENAFKTGIDKPRNVLGE